MFVNTKQTRKLGAAIYVASIVLLVAVGFTAAQTNEPPKQSPVESVVADQEPVVSSIPERIVTESPEKLEQSQEDKPSKSLVKKSAETATANLKPLDGETYSMLAGATLRFECEFRIPQILVHDPAVVGVTPLSPTEVLVTASAPGFASVTFKGEHDEEVTIEIKVKTNVEKLSRSLSLYFPNSKIEVEAFTDPNLVLLKGRTTAAQMASVIAHVKDHFPRVINQLKTESELSHVAMQIRSYEVDSKKLQAIGIFNTVAGEKMNVSRIVELLTEPDSKDEIVRAKGRFVKVFRDTKRLLAILEKLEQKSVVELKDQPVLVAELSTPAEWIGGDLNAHLIDEAEFLANGAMLNLVAGFAATVNQPKRLFLELKAEFPQIRGEMMANDGKPIYQARRFSAGMTLSAGATAAIVLEPFVDGKQKEIVILVTPKPIADAEVRMAPAGNTK